jgi:hypothetical protein
MERPSVKQSFIGVAILAVVIVAVLMIVQRFSPGLPSGRSEMVAHFSAPLVPSVVLSIHPSLRQFIADNERPQDSSTGRHPQPVNDGKEGKVTWPAEHPLSS